MNGNNVYIMADNTIIAATKSNELQVGCDTIEIASSSQQAWKEYIAGRKEWSMTVSYLVTAVKMSAPQSPLNIGTTYTLKFQNRNTPDDYVTGSAICTQCKITATRGNLCSGSITFKGTGALS